MRRHVYFGIIAALSIAAAVLYPAAGDDTIKLECATDPVAHQCPQGSNGILLTKATDVRKKIRSATNDATFSSIDPTYRQVMAFRRGFRPAYNTNAVWTGDSDTLTLTFELLFPLNIRIWVICSDKNVDCDKPMPASRVTYLTNFRTNSNVVLNSERVGVELAAAEGTLITDNADTRDGASELGDFNSDNCDDLREWATVASNRRLDGVVNIYVVAKVDRGPGNGFNCSKDQEKLVIVGATATWKTILHEVGHALSLHDLPREDVVWDADKDQKENFMRSYSNTRKYFTEAQIFRIHLNDLSAVKGVFPPVRNCGLGDNDAEIETPPCPKLRERVWPEP